MGVFRWHGILRYFSEQEDLAGGMLARLDDVGPTADSLY